jgi:nucleoredoxin
MKKSTLSLLLTAALAAVIATSASANLGELFPEKLQNAQGQEVARDAALKGKLIGVYFSAQWCPPCRTFTPQLVSFANANQQKLAVVFVSSDRTPEAQNKYMTEYKMPWAATPHASAAGKAMGRERGVAGIPTLLVFDKNGVFVTKEGRNLAELKAILDR